MARKTRIWYPGAMYHVMCRGHRGQAIFLDNEDRRVFLNRLLHAIRDHSCNILSYCLMTNHVHLQVETSQVELWKMMKQLNMMYAIFFNKRYDYVGPLFQGRYRANLIRSLARRLEVSRYIHLNPVAAKLVTTPLDYPWSSYSVYMGVGEDPVVSPERLLESPLEQRERYQRYVEDDRGQTP